MSYDYTLEKYSPEYKDALARQAAISKELNQVNDVLSDIQHKEDLAKEAWLTAEVEALLKTDKSNKVDKAKSAYDTIKSQHRVLTDKLEILERAAVAIRPELENLKDIAKCMAFEAAREDHEKAAAKTMKIIRELSEAQAEEAAVINAHNRISGGFSSMLIGTLNFLPNVGNEQIYGTVLFRLVTELRNRGYNI